MKAFVMPLVGAALVFGSCHSASALITLYNDGPIDLSGTGYNIGNGNLTTDSFNVNNNWTVFGVDFGSLNVPGDPITSIDWMITPLPGFGIPEGSGTASVSSVPAGTDNAVLNYSQVYENSFSISPVKLTPGTYYLTLGNVGTAGPTAYWSVSQGPSSSTGYYDLSTTYQGLPVAPESFDLIGTVPEPNGLIPVTLGIGIVGMLAYRRRKANV